MNAKRQHIPVFALVVFLNLLLFGFIGKYAPILQVDTANYFSAAYNLYNGNGLLMFDGNYLQNTPPLFSIFLVPTYYLKIPESIYINIILGFSFNLTILFVFKLVKVIGLKNPIVGTLLSMLFGFTWTHVWSSALSEVLFVPIFVAWVYYTISQYQNNWIKWSLVLTGLVLTRYIGWFLVVGFLSHTFLGRKERLKLKLVWAFMPAVLMTAIWLLVNYRMNGQALGAHSLAEKWSVMALYNNFKSWIQAFFSHQFRLNVAFLIFLVITLITAILPRFWYVDPTLKLARFLSLLFHLCVFMTFLLFIQPGLSLVQLPRYISFFWPVLGVFLVFLIEIIVDSTKTANILLVLVLFCQILALFNWAKKHHHESKNQFLSHLHFSQILKENSQYLNSEMMSNFPDLVWWLTKCQCAYSPFTNESENTFISRLGSSREITLVWFENEERAKVMKSDVQEILQVQNKKPCLLGQGFSIYKLDSNSRFYWP